MQQASLHDRLKLPDPGNGEEGFALIMLIVAIFIILLVLGIAAPRVARDLRREREVEALHRGNQYVRAVQLYYRKFGNYPTSIDQLEKTTNIRFLRQKYIDPMTGKADWRIIHVGENKTTVKGLFGQPLTGLPGGAGLGGASLGGTQTVSGTSTGSASGLSGSTMSGTSSGFGSSTSSTGTSSTSTGIGGTGSSSFGGPATTADGSTTSSSGISSQSATGFKGSGGPIMGFGSSQSGTSIVTLNEQADYSKWEFLYDPRIEQLKARSSLFGGGGMGSSNGASGSSTGSSTFGSGSNGSSFGSSGSSSPAGTYGASPGSATGTSSGGTTTTPTLPTSTTPQP